MGFEAVSGDGNQAIIDELRDLVNERKKAAATYNRDSPEYHQELLHAVWWVTDCRLEPGLAKMVYDIFDKEVPIFIIVNKSDKLSTEVDASISQIADLCRQWAIAVIAVLPVVASAKNGPLKKLCQHCGSPNIRVSEHDKVYECRDQQCAKYRQDIPLEDSYGFPKLLEATLQRLPDIVAASFAATQKEWLEGMDCRANLVIGSASTAAAAIGGSPIPCSDYYLLCALQSAMMASLGKVYELRIKPQAMMQLLQSVAGLCVSAQCGLKMGSILKSIPGIGTILGGATSATLAAVVTFSLGMLLKELLRRVRGRAEFGEITYDHFLEVMGIEEQRAFFRRWLFSPGSQANSPWVPSAPPAPDPDEQHVRAQEAQALWPSVA